VPRLKIDKDVFYTEFKISEEQINYGDSWRAGTFNQNNLIPDIDQELIDNPASESVPKYQTKTGLYGRMKGRKHWDDLFRKVCHSLMRIYTKPMTLVESWANLAKENSNFGLHNHYSDLTVVYYLKCNYPEYGTNIDNKVVIPAINDSLLIFNGKIKHQLMNMPFELAVHPHNHRYSLVFDFNIDKSINPDNITK